MSILWSKEAFKGLGKLVDDKVELPALLEMFDGLFVTYGSTILFEKYETKLPEKIQEALKKVGIIFENYNKTGELEATSFVTEEVIVDIVNGIVDIPGIEEDDEAIILSTIVTGVFMVVKKYIIKNEE